MKYTALSRQTVALLLSTDFNLNAWEGFTNDIKQGRPGGVVEYQYTRKKIDKIPQNTPNSSKYTQK